MSLKILTTSKSISIADCNNNKLIVVKTDTGLEFHSSISNTKVNSLILGIQKEIKRIVLNPTDNRDNYKVRFHKLATDIVSLDKSNFLSLNKSLVKS